MEEYSFFRAEGKSYEAIQTVVSAKSEIFRLSRKACDRFGAEDFVADKKSPSFRFSPSQGMPPQEWIVKEERLHASGRGDIVSIYAVPPKGSAEEDFTNLVSQMMVELEPLTRLEHVLGCGNMPVKHLPAGRYISTFVRNRDVDDNPMGSTRNIGLLKDAFNSCTFSSAPISKSNPLAFIEFTNGECYIRVPNDDKGKPVFTPPDAVRIDYDEMIRLDKAEHNRRFPPSDWHVTPRFP
jgi:hypothetical protein